MHKNIVKLLNLYYKYGPNFIMNYDNNDELFKIYLLILKEKENNESDTRLESILLHLNPMFSNKLQNIKYINKGIDLDDKNTIEYKESESRIYLFDEKDIDDIKNYQINPYSGRIIKKSFFNKYFPDIVYKGYNIENYCESPTDENNFLVFNWVNNFKSFYCSFGKNGNFCDNIFSARKIPANLNNIKSSFIFLKNEKITMTKIITT